MTPDSMPVTQRFAVAVDHRQFHVDARPQGQVSGAGPGTGHAVQGVQEPDREVVGDDRAGEAVAVPEQVGEQGGVGRHRDPVQVGVGVHHRPGAGPQRHLERGQQHVGQFARADGDRGHVPRAARGRVAGEVLQRGHDARRLQAADVAAADRADQVGVLADGLLGPPPAQVAHHVEDRRQALVHAEPAHGARRCARSSARPARGRSSPPSTAATGRRWPARRPARSGTPRAPGPGCPAGLPR